MPTNQKPRAPTPDTADLRLPFGVLPEPLQPRTSENDRAYGAFLLFCMQAPAERSLRLLGKALNCSDGTIRYWKKKHAWERRMTTARNTEWEALRGYRLLMDLQASAGHVAALRVAMDVVLDRAGYAQLRHAVHAQRQGRPAGPTDHDQVPTDKPGTPEAATTSSPSAKPGTGTKTTTGPQDAQHGPTAAFRTPLSDNELETLDAAEHMRQLRAKVLTDHLRPEDVRRQVLLIDAVLGMIAKKVGDGSLDVKVSDIPQLLKARALLTGLPTEQVAMAVRHQHEVVVESARIADGRAKGGNALLVAMQEELIELNTIIGAVPRDTIEAEQEA
jgi:hypothetical protein